VSIGARLFLEKTIVVAGTFDILHPGHINFFEQAKKHGDRLIVIIARDATVKKIKGKLPKNKENDRLKKVQNQELVDRAILGQLQDPIQTVANLKPDVLALGYDQRTFTERLKAELGKRGCYPKIVRLKPYRPNKYKSSKY